MKTPPCVVDKLSRERGSTTVDVFFNMYHDMSSIKRWHGRRLTLTDPHDVSDIQRTHGRDLTFRVILFYCLLTLCSRFSHNSSQFESRREGPRFKIKFQKTNHVLIYCLSTYVRKNKIFVYFDFTKIVIRSETYLELV